MIDVNDWPVSSLPDEELAYLNDMLPWAAFVRDSRGRDFGKAYSEKKRNNPHVLPDRRLVQFHDRFNLSGGSVLEVGCFEGLHTTSLCTMADRVVAIDGRIENVAKTLVRCAMLGQFPKVYVWNLELDCPDYLEPQIRDTSFLVHIGVLYHLSDPVGHLAAVARHINRAILLDTHIAGPDDAISEYDAIGESWSYRDYREGPRASPFAGLVPTARWLTEDSLVQALKTVGFGDVDIVSKREERNGWRVTVFAGK